MANFPQLDDTRGVWKLKEVNNAVMGGYWRGSGIALVQGNLLNGTVEKYNLITNGNTTAFGNLVDVDKQYYSAGVSSNTRAIKGGGNDADENAVQAIDYATFSTDGNYADFGDLSAATNYNAGSSNSTRGIFGTGNVPGVSNKIEYITMASTGNVTDFGDVTVARTQAGATSSPTRSLFAGGTTPTVQNVIDFVTQSSTGNATDFGDLVGTIRQLNQGIISSSTRGVFAGGFNPSMSSVVQNVTMASQGNAIDYGDLLQPIRLQASASDSVRGVCFYGYSNPGYEQQIEQFNIASGGQSVNTGGDTTVTSGGGSGVSDSHGGLNEGYQGTRIAPIPRGGGTGQRLIFAGGEYNYTTKVGFVTISTLGNEEDFGELVTATSALAGASSSTRCLIGGGQTPSGNLVTISYAEFSSKGNFADFGDLTSRRDKLPGFANDTRGVWGAGRDNSDDNALANIIDYVTIATIGNASDFGDATVSRQGGSGTSSTTRGLFGGGFTPSYSDVIDYVTIANTGNATDFGNLTVARAASGNSASSSTRATFAGGSGSPANSNVIDYVTIASTGNASDFGDLEFITAYASGSSNSTRGVYSGFNNTSATGADGTFGNCPHISYITIASTGNYTDFGDLSHHPRTNSGRYAIAAASNGHGGLA